MAAVDDTPISLPALFWRFLRFGLLAWGGPVAQIGMLRRELIDEERWVESARFNRVLAVYQVLPGPEAHELCVYLGHSRRGRIGGLVAGLGFMLPGLLLVLAFAWAYERFGVRGAVASGLFFGFAPAVAALVLRALHRIAGHALHDGWLVAITLASAASQLVGAPFLLSLATGGLTYLAVSRQHPRIAAALLVLLVIGAGAWNVTTVAGHDQFDGPRTNELRTPSLTEVAAAGARGGLLTFGGAYTAIPFVEHDAVRDGHWMTRQQFLDGLAISGSIPAPLIIFATFVGYVGGGSLLAALLMTAAIFTPAFAFTLLGHRHVERAVENVRLHALLDGITAAVVGLMLVTAAAILLGALVVLHRWRSRASIVCVMALAGMVGMLLG